MFDAPMPPVSLANMPPMMPQPHMFLGDYELSEGGGAIYDEFEQLEANAEQLSFEANHLFDDDNTINHPISFVDAYHPHPGPHPGPGPVDSPEELALSTPKLVKSSNKLKKVVGFDHAEEDEDI